MIGDERMKEHSPSTGLFDLGTEKLYDNGYVCCVKWLVFSKYTLVMDFGDGGNDVSVYVLVILPTHDINIYYTLVIHSFVHY